MNRNVRTKIEICAVAVGATPTAAVAGVIGGKALTALAAKGGTAAVAAMAPAIGIVGGVLTGIAAGVAAGFCIVGIIRAIDWAINGLWGLFRRTNEEEVPPIIQPEVPPVNNRGVPFNLADKIAELVNLNEKFKNIKDVSDESEIDLVVVELFCKCLEICHELKIPFVIVKTDQCEYHLLSLLFTLKHIYDRIKRTTSEEKQENSESVGAGEVVRESTSARAGEVEIDNRNVGGDERSDNNRNLEKIIDGIANEVKTRKDMFSYLEYTFNTKKKNHKEKSITTEEDAQKYENQNSNPNPVKKNKIEHKSKGKILKLKVQKLYPDEAKLDSQIHDVVFETSEEDGLKFIFMKWDGTGRKIFEL